MSEPLMGDDTRLTMKSARALHYPARIIGLTILLASICFAQNPSFIASVDKNQVAVGEQFEVTFTLSASGGAQNFRAPAFKDFEILGGPNHSTKMQFVNGT